MTACRIGYHPRVTNDDQHTDPSGDAPDSTEPEQEEVDRLDDDAPGTSLFEEGDDNEPSEPA